MPGHRRAGAIGTTGHPGEGGMETRTVMDFVLSLVGGAALLLALDALLGFPF